MQNVHLSRKLVDIGQCTTAAHAYDKAHRGTCQMRLQTYKYGTSLKRMSNS